MTSSRLRRLTFPLLPTICTLANGVCGLAAITLATSRNPAIPPTELVFYAGLLIFLGMLFDVLDGHVARMTRQTSQFGKELDSLCDVITFGVAPVFVMLTFSGALHPRLLWGIGVLYTLSAILRLARFNVQKDEHSATDFFSGLPTPMAAGVIASFAISLPALEKLLGPEMSEASQDMGARLIAATMFLVPVLTGVVAWLMVSRFKYPHMAYELNRRRSFPQLVELVFAIVVVVMLHELALPLLFCYFVLAPPINELRLRAVARGRVAREARAAVVSGGAGRDLRDRHP
jgi:CDP-diacylglycerol---serine O-phosphatidyltransferase